MLNIEKYRDEILKYRLQFAKKKGKLYRCYDTECIDCDFYTREENCCENVLDWFCSEYVELPTLTEQEWHFCMAVQTGWIARDKSGFMHAYNKKPEKNETDWGINGDFYQAPQYLSFDFIRWTDTEPWAVEDLLKLEVRKEPKQKPTEETKRRSDLDGRKTRNDSNRIPKREVKNDK